MALREIVVDDVWWVVFAAPHGASGSGGEPAPRRVWAQSLSEKRPLVDLGDWEAWPDARLADAIRHARPLPPLPLPLP